MSSLFKISCSKVHVPFCTLSHFRSSILGHRLRFTSLSDIKILISVDIAGASHIMFCNIWPIWDNCHGIIMTIDCNNYKYKDCTCIYHMTCVMRKQTVRSLLLSCQKKDGRAWPRHPSFGMTPSFFENVIYDDSRVKFWKVVVIPKEGWVSGQRSLSSVFSWHASHSRLAKERHTDIITCHYYTSITKKALKCSSFQVVM